MAISTSDLGLLVYVIFVRDNFVFLTNFLLLITWANTHGTPLSESGFDLPPGSPGFYPGWKTCDPL